MKLMQFDKYLYKYWKLQTMVIILGLITVPLSLVNPYLTKLLIDKAYGNKDVELFLILAFIGGSSFIFNGLINSFREYLSKRLNRSVYFNMTKDFFRHLQSLPLSFFNNHSTGEHIYRLNADVGSVSNFVCSVIPQIAALLPRLIFIFAMVFYLNWKLALFTTLLVPLTYIQPYLFAKWLTEISRRARSKSQGIFRNLQEVFSHIHLVKAMGKEKYEIRKFEERLEEKIRTEIQDSKVSSAGNFLSSIVHRIVSGLIALYGGYQVIKGAMTLGSLTAIMIYLAQLTGLLQSIGGLYQTVIVSAVPCKRLEEILDIKPTICDSKDAVSYNINKGKVEFKDVFFGYKKGVSVLSGLNLAIESASKIALVGPSGCGKTTVLSLILRLYEQKKGAIFIDGLDIRKIKLESLKSGIGVALQEPFLWNDTAKNNILYCGEDLGHEDVLRAAKIAEAHDFIMNFPNGYDTVIGEMACKISEGQKQRIAVARAVIKRPRILILDEAMSSIDSETEGKIADNIRSEFGSSTVIAVSHRLSTVKKMDLVYFLESPSRMEVGTHRSLIEKNSKYRELFASQLEEEGREPVENGIQEAELI